jgi:hypothetical protein
MAREYYFVASPGILGIRTNVKRFKWSYGISMPQVAREDYDACLLRFQVEITRDLPVPHNSKQARKYHYWLGSPGEDWLHYDRAFGLGRRLQMTAAGLFGDEPSFKVNRTYYRFISHRFMNLHSIGYVLTDVASLLLLRKGYAPLHCSAFRHEHATVIVAAPPNTGKTLTSMSASIDHGADYIAEDLALTDGRDVVSIPWTSTFRYYKQIDRNPLARLRNVATGYVPVIELLPRRRPKAVTQYVPPHQMTDRSRVTHVVLLEPGAASLRNADLDEACRKIRNLNRYEFNYSKAPFIVAYEYFNPRLSIDTTCRTEEFLIRRLLENCDHRWVVSSHDPTRYADMIIQALKGQSYVQPLELGAA